jgi:hypothetical protein
LAAGFDSPAQRGQAAGFDSADDSFDSFRLKLDLMDAAAKQIKLVLNFLHAGKEQNAG